MKSLIFFVFFMHSSFLKAFEWYSIKSIEILQLNYTKLKSNLIDLVVKIYLSYINISV